MAHRGPARPLSVAPMMAHTDRHFRWVLRQLSRRTLLYTEMVVGHAIRHGDRSRLLGFDPCEHPVALQLGGDDPALMADCAVLAEDLGYDEVNLNVGCPSDRVQSGCFGAVLMRTPDRVADVVLAMRQAVQIPVTVKCRIGVDDEDAYEDLIRFIDTVAAAGTDRFVVHARKAVLGGLSPRQNREIPPLRHPDVHRLKRERPALRIETNGAVRTHAAVLDHLNYVDGVMVGRVLIDDPMWLAEVDAAIFGEPGAPLTRVALVERIADYVDRWQGTPGFRPGHVLRHLMGLFNGMPGARRWRRTLTEQGDSGTPALLAGLAAVTGV